MPHVEIQGKNYEITDAGFLVEREGWTEELAAALADLAGVELTPAHWEIVSFIREYYSRITTCPTTVCSLRQSGSNWGTKRGIPAIFTAFSPKLR
jgi:tRNA 2-thiouridine synthesizing protein E